MIQRVHHQFGPYVQKDSKILILGSFPSVKSREASFYYGHPQNRFWKVISCIFQDNLPVSVEQKKTLLSTHQIALWDVIESCDIKGSSDASIRNVIPTNLEELLKEIPIQKILINGKTAYHYYLKYHQDLDVPAICMPSTSPANAAWSLTQLIDVYEKELKV
ncbi:MAG: DNA-deoxyinosine glycosylase [Erysipelotrichaceae bacterium]|nr:DNA-deoxyinosine glycosylase [Erysipelotrichaceae bacterium]